MRNIAKLKIAFTGPSMCGKTTLATKVSESLNEQGIHLPYINLSGSSIWEEFGFTSHQDILIKTAMSPEIGLAYQERLLEKRTEIINNNDGFVTERSPLDNMLYFLKQNAPYLDQHQTRAYFDKCVEQIEKLDYIFLLPPLYHEGQSATRINNPYIIDMDYELLLWLVNRMKVSKRASRRRASIKIINLSLPLEKRKDYVVESVKAIISKNKTL